MPIGAHFRKVLGVTYLPRSATLRYPTKVVKWDGIPCTLNRPWMLLTRCGHCAQSLWSKHCRKYVAHPSLNPAAGTYRGVATRGKGAGMTVLWENWSRRVMLPPCVASSGEREQWRRRPQEQQQQLTTLLISHFYCFYCFRFQISCCIFRCGRLKIIWGVWARSLGQLMKLYQRPTFRNTVHLMAVFCAAAEWCTDNSTAAFIKAFGHFDVGQPNDYNYNWYNPWHVWCLIHPAIQHLLNYRTIVRVSHTRSHCQRIKINSTYTQTVV